MKFLSKKCCKKLSKLGCKPCGFNFFFKGTEKDLKNYPIYGVMGMRWLDEGEEIGKKIFAFSPYDFLGDSEQAMENCSILYGVGGIIEREIDGRNVLFTGNRILRELILHSTDQVQFIEDIVRKI